MSGYTKLFSSILHSTVWLAPGPTRLVWITMLALTDRDGIVEASVPGLAKAAGVTREETDAALAFLAAPDPDSRTKDHEGRRIVEIDGGWRLLNHGKYRERLSAEDVREKAAARKLAQREREKAEDAKANEDLRSLIARDEAKRAELSQDPVSSTVVTPGSQEVTLGHAPSRDVAGCPAPSLHTDPSPDSDPERERRSLDEEGGESEIFPARPAGTPPPSRSLKSLSLFRPDADGVRLPEFIRRGAEDGYKSIKLVPPRETKDLLWKGWYELGLWVVAKAGLIGWDEPTTARHLMRCFLRSKKAHGLGYPIKFLRENANEYWRDELPAEIARAS